MNKRKSSVKDCKPSESWSHVIVNCMMLLMLSFLADKKVQVCTPMEKDPRASDTAAFHSIFKNNNIAKNIDFSSPAPPVVAPPAPLNFYCVSPLPTVPSNVINIDEDSLRTSTYDPTYARFIFQNKMKAEVSFLVHCVKCRQAHLTLYLIHQTKLVITKQVLGRYQMAITKNVYAILCNYLSEICTDNCLQTSSFVSCMHLLDRVLALRPVALSDFQMIGCACLLVSSKLEDIYVSSLF